MTADVPLPQRKKRRRWKLLAGALLVSLFSAVIAWRVMIVMPGESFAGPLADLDVSQAALGVELRRDVTKLAVEIGERNLDQYGAIERAAEFIELQLGAAGYEVKRQTYQVRGLDCWNLEVEIPGGSRADEIVIVGAHYDSYRGTPGANDNASGTAAMLALARRFAHARPERTLRFVAFTNEEPPYFQNESMGSWVYAWRSRTRGEKLLCVLSLETIGYYSDEPASQQYPPPLGAIYPSEGNFIGVVGDVGSRELVREVIASFRRHGRFPSEGAAMPAAMPGVGWSDHWSFWQAGYKAAMITDTAPFRYPYYHTADDLPERLDFDHMVRVVEGLTGVIEDFAKIEPGR